MERQHFVHVVAYGVAWGGFETVVTYAAQCDLGPLQTRAASTIALVSCLRAFGNY